jgi:hypothetical protein
MRLVNERCSSSICSPILTYNNQGVSKDSVVKWKHAIAFTGRKDKEPSPHQLELPVVGEYGMMSPIRIKARSKQEKLHAMSRINFSKMYTVEHNVKVYDFGDVDSQHKERLRTQWRYVLDHDGKGHPSEVSPKPSYQMPVQTVGHPQTYASPQSYTTQTYGTTPSYSSTSAYSQTQSYQSPVANQGYQQNPEVSYATTRTGYGAGTNTSHATTSTPGYIAAANYSYGSNTTPSFGTTAPTSYGPTGPQSYSSSAPQSYSTSTTLGYNTQPTSHGYTQHQETDDDEEDE